MIKLKQAVVVEGRYDKNALRQLIDAPIFETSGFGVMKNRELVSLLRYSSNNLNQLTRRVHETGRIYGADMDDILQNQERIWQTVSGILSQLAAIK